jgi:GntR family transcriptional repressor for pyruvate dehydrogenase complex
MVPIAQDKSRKARFRALGRKDDLVDRVVHAIEAQILDGRLGVGAKLPPEREFSDRMGVSRTVVREAVRILVTNGLLETRHGIGTMVRAVTHKEVVRPLTLFLRTIDNEVSLTHLHQVRRILEIETAGIAAQQAEPSDIDELRRIIAEMDASAADRQRFAEKDAEFHRRLGQSTHNPLISLLLDSIHDLIYEVFKLVANEPGLVERVMDGHRKILARVAAKDPTGARKAMGEHLAAARGIQIAMLHETKLNAGSKAALVRVST